jgi:type II secretory pathway component PulM
MTPKPTPADRIRRGSPVAQTAGRAVRDAVRVKPVRITVDLDPGPYEALVDWTVAAGRTKGRRVTHAEVMRQLVTLLTTDTTTAEQVITALT